MQKLTRDGYLLFATRIARLFAYGFLSVVLVLYLSSAGFSTPEIGLLLTLTLIGDTLISLWITTQADFIGRKRMLLAGAGLMLLAGLVFALTRNYLFLVLAATIGVISPSGNEVGPFLAIEQASLAQIVTDRRRTPIFAWYNLVGSFATATGAFIGGGLAQLLQNNSVQPLMSYRAVVIGYAVMGGVLAVLFSQLTNGIEAPLRSNHASVRSRLGLHRSRKVVFRLSALFALDAFAGGFVVQSIVSYWFHTRFGVPPGVLGAIFFGANVLAGVSALLAARIAAKIGLINTMVFTHIPSNVLLLLVPFMPTLPLAIVLLLLRFSISQMDVPTRQSYIMAVVEPDERSAAAGVTGIARTTGATGIARTTGAAPSPSLAGPLLASAGLLGLPFVISGTLKVIYDVLLWFNFRRIKPPEEQG